MRAQEADAESIAIGYRTRDAAHADSTAGAGYVFNNDGLAERDPHALGHDAPNRICWPASRKRYDHRDRPRRIVLRPSNARYGRQRGSAGNEDARIVFGGEVSWRSCVLPARQAHREHRTLSRLARHGHVAAHHARELAGDGQAESRPAVAARGE